MNLDKKKLDELFSEEESAQAEKKAKSKVGSRARVKRSAVEPVLSPAAQEFLDDADDAVEDALDDGFDERPLEAETAEESAPEDFDDEDTPDGDVEEIVLNTNKAVNTVFDWIGSLLIALVCVLLAMSFCFRVIDVDGTSMEPTLINTDKVVITDLFYTPHNGDIIVISHAEMYDKPLVKRVIAIPGQTLEVDFQAGTVKVDGVLLDESGYTQGYLKEGDLTEEEINGVIPEGKLFVMGDNRAVSLDSRSRQIGLIDLDCVIGKAQLDVVPHSYKDGQISGKDKPSLDLSRIRYLY